MTGNGLARGARFRQRRAASKRRPTVRVGRRTSDQLDQFPYLTEQPYAAVVGVLCPMILQRMGRDPVMGSSILLTAITDSMGFFIFLALASVLLL